MFGMLLKCIYVVTCGFNYQIPDLCVNSNDQTWNLLLPQPCSPILVFHLNSGTPPYHYLLGSTVESLASLSISLRLKLSVRLVCLLRLVRYESCDLFLTPIECESLP